jgi:16S rRNA (guanine966-N2)-methyltransferase
VALLRVRDRTRIFKRDALPFAGALEADAYDVAFADPPYGSRMLDRVLDDWHARHFSRVLAVEHSASHELPRPAKRLTLDDTVLGIYRA